jgi:hypothetical protein
MSIETLLKDARPMPTGYTAAVCDGKLTEFRDFALSCARAFGALITMRDDPMDAPIPDKIEASSYSAQRYAGAKERLAQLRTMTPEQAEVAAFKAHQEAAANAAKWNADADSENERLEAMRQKVLAWTPPTPDHVNLKDFMVEQLTISKHTYRHEIPGRLTGQAWLSEQIATAERDIEYHGKSQREENERAAGRTAWIKALKSSI